MRPTALGPNSTGTKTLTASRGQESALRLVVNAAILGRLSELPLAALAQLRSSRELRFAAAEPVSRSQRRPLRNPKKYLHLAMQTGLS
ncbi:MAG: hypothetical protein M2R45_04063 [Verrucomicrobia subdivision 3 bacterium]|nr:hypothetical protein [Limisphaerales bacterium]MCS1410868.1 hypothetical protein [Limisphaerales bacterium]MCS1417002.1 hypothetical protein [Limisphaerales bacterium]